METKKLSKLAKALGECVAARSAQGWKETAAFERLEQEFPEWPELVKTLDRGGWLTVRETDLEELLKAKRLLSENLARAQERSTQLLEMTRTLRRERNAAATVSSEGTWIWSDTDDNHLDSLVEDAVVTMTAGQLRSLLKLRG